MTAENKAQLVECILKPNNLSEYVPLTNFHFGSIPEHLIFYGTIMVLSLLFYCALSKIDCGSPNATNNRQPTFWRLLFMQEDDWIEEERGGAALDYIKFQRSLIIHIGPILLIVSMASLAINISKAGKDNLSTFDSTTIQSIENYDELHWFSVTMCLFVPVIIILCISYHARHLENDITTSYDESRTVVVEGVNKAQEMDNEDVRKFWAERYPKCNLVEHFWGYKTAKLRRLYVELCYVEGTLEILQQTGAKKNAYYCDSLTLSCFFCGNKKIEDYKNKQAQLKKYIQREARDSMLNINRLSIIFLTFETNAQARRVVTLENGMPTWGNRKQNLSNYSVSLAPHPKDIIWANLRNNSVSWLYFVIFHFIILIVLIFFATPAAFATQVQQLLKPLLEKLKFKSIVVSIVPTLMFFIFSLLMPQLIREGTVTFGYWSYPEVVPNYMIRLYCWNLCSIVILPLLMLTNGSGIAAFIAKSITPLWALIGSTHILPDSKWNCVFLPDSGAFFINYTIVSCLLRSQLQLYRVGDKLYALWLMIISCGSRAEKTTARNIADEYNRERTGVNMSLTEDYVWVLLHFSIAITFCVSCPLVTPFYLLYLISKHMVDIQNFRLYYTANFHQALLVRTAIKIAIFCSLLINFNTGAIILTQRIEDKGTYMSMVSGCVAIYSFVGFMFFQSSGWTFPYRLYHKKKINLRKPLDCTPYIDPFLLNVKNHRKRPTYCA